MRFYLFKSLRKLELAKYSLILSLQAFLFVVIVKRLNYKMTLRGSFASYLENKNANSHYTFDRENIRISCNNKKILFTHEKETDADDSPTISYKIKTNACLDASSLIYGLEKYSHMFMSLKSGVLICDLYQDERYPLKRSQKSLFNGTYKTTEECSGKEARPVEKNVSKPQDSSKSYSKETVCAVNFSKNGCAKNKRWATWKNSKSVISYQSDYLSAKQAELSEILTVLEKYFPKKQVLVPVKTVAGDDGFIKGNKHQTTFNKTEILKESKTSSFEATSKQILSNAKYDCTCLKEANTSNPFNCAITDLQLPITEDETPKSVKRSSKEAISEQILSNTRENSNSSKGERKTFASEWAPKLSINENECKMSKTGNFTFEKNLSKLILSIMLDDSNSDLHNLEHEVNCYHSSSKTSSINWEYNKAYNCDESLVPTPRKESFCTDYQFTNDSDDISEISEGQCSKRTRVNSADSGICLDSNFEQILPESPAQESDSSKDASSSTCKTGVSYEFTSRLNSADPLNVDDCHRVCQLCEMVVLNKFFLTSRFGLLLNCVHSFCYSCIRNHSKSKRLCTGSVKCPKCGKKSPGIVSSPRWIKDTYEKTILFRKYEKESKFFSKQQQVFLNLVSI